MANPLIVDTSADQIGAGTQASVAQSATDVTILAASTSRLGGAIFFNDSTSTLYLLFAAGTSSATNYSVQVYAGQAYTLLIPYNGIVKGIWAGAGAGACRVTSFGA